MRFLLDNNLSPRLAELLRAADDDVVHVRDIGMVSATDPVVIDEARAQGRVRISADTDFGTLLARTHATTPSFLLIRRASGRRASEQAAIILNNPQRCPSRPGRRRPSSCWARRRYASADFPSGHLARANSPSICATNVPSGERAHASRLIGTQSDGVSNPCSSRRSLPRAICRVGED